MRCRLCRCREPDPVRLVHADTYVPRYGRRMSLVPVHVECWLANGEDIAQLADHQLWHLSGAAWRHFGFLDGDHPSHIVADPLDQAEQEPPRPDYATGRLVLVVAPSPSPGPSPSPTSEIYTPRLRPSPSVADYGDTSPVGRERRTGRKSPPMSPAMRRAA